MIKYDQEDIDRFYSKITVIEEGENAGCWEVDLYKDKDGYSRISVNNKAIFCHRFMYQIWHPEEDIDDKVIRHSCDHPQCCCPDHLTSGTIQDNNNDMVNKDRHAKGDTCGLSILTEENINEIINNTLSGRFTSCNQIAYRYEITYHTINQLINEKIWKHITKDYDMVKIRELLDNHTGCNHYKASFSEDNIRDIRQRLKNGESGASIAKSYKTSDSLISQIKLNKKYKNIV